MCFCGYTNFLSTRTAFAKSNVSESAWSKSIMEKVCFCNTLNIATAKTLYYGMVGRNRWHFHFSILIILMLRTICIVARFEILQVYSFTSYGQSTFFSLTRLILCDIYSLLPQANKIYPKLLCFRYIYCQSKICDQQAYLSKVNFTF